MKMMSGSVLIIATFVAVVVVNGYSVPCTEPAEPNSPTCLGHGTLQCGECNCDSAYYGRHCECNAGDRIYQEDIENVCKSPDDRTNLVCSGRGDCTCGQCACLTRPNPEEVIGGQYCECDNFSCDRSGGQLCGGRDRGVCHCGRCVCSAGYIGSTCENEPRSESTY